MVSKDEARATLTRNLGSDLELPEKVGRLGHMNDSLTLDAFTQLSLQARKELARKVCRILGESWSPAAQQSDADVLLLTCAPFDTLFALVPGGTFEMGISAEDLAEAQDYVDWTNDAVKVAAAYASCAVPVHAVSVAPFLCSVDPLEAESLAELSGMTFEEDGFEVPEVRQAIESLGFRLPTEAELEWLAREGGRYRSILNIGPNYEVAGESSEKAIHRFAMKGMVYSQWADDDWHPNYEGAPCNSKAWRGGDPIGVVRGGIYLEMIASTEGLLNSLAGRRRSGAELRDDGFLVMRLARDLPPNVA